MVPTATKATIDSSVSRASSLAGLQVSMKVTYKTFDWRCVELCRSNGPSYSSSLVRPTFVFNLVRSYTVYLLKDSGGGDSRSGGRQSDQFGDVPI
jgi:hypothetical protein